MPKTLGTINIPIDDGKIVVFEIRAQDADNAIAVWATYFRGAQKPSTPDEIQKAFVALATDAVVRERMQEEAAEALAAYLDQQEAQVISIRGRRPHDA